MVGVSRFPPANQAGMPGDRSDVVPVANPARLRQGEHALIDGPGSLPCHRLCLVLCGSWRLRFHLVCEHRQFHYEDFFDLLRVRSREPVLFG